MPKIRRDGNICWLRGAFQCLEFRSWIALLGLVEEDLPDLAGFRSVSYPIRIHAGSGTLARLADEAGRFKAERVLAICGQSVAQRTGLMEQVREVLGNGLAGVFEGVKAGSPLEAVERAAEKAAEVDADLLVAVGGGSAVVTARAAIILLGEGGNARDHATKYPPGEPPVSPRLNKPKIPNILVPTTPTTAVNRAGAAVIDPETGHRLELFDPKTRPAAVIWDEEALLSASPALCLSAAASCYSGVVGALQVRELNPLTEGDLLQALRLLTENMPLVRTSPRDGRVRLNLAAAAFLMNRSGDTRGGSSAGATAVVSSLAHSLDTRYPECDHGSAYSILTAPGMRFNRGQNAAGQARLARAMGLEEQGGDDERLAESAADLVSGTYGELGLPLRLRDVGVTWEGIGQIAEDAMTDFNLHRNVRRVSDPTELEALLQEIW